MTKLVFIIISFIFLSFFPLILIAQEQDIEDLQVGIETAGQLLTDIPVTHFEDADTWNYSMAIDQGVLFAMKRKGRPIDLPEIDPGDGTENKYVLGVKVAYNRRGYAKFSLAPNRPIKIPGITKALSLWVCGRSFKHRLHIHLLDYKGDEMFLDMGPIDFIGWQQMKIVVPPTIEQHNYHDSSWRGISIAGMSVYTDPEESYGVYYIYFDELRAITDIYSEEHRDEDDMEDGW